jgi:hypothetical protein
MGDRYERIPEAYKQTFDWIFHDAKDLTGPAIATTSGQDAFDDWTARAGRQSPRKMGKWDNFVQWLRGPERLHWITGKPGAGKSTLMKYLYNDSRSLENVRLWSGNNRLTTAGFFFWNSGPSMQMSRLGLLQSLIHKATMDDPDLMPHIYPDRWRSYALFGGDLHP